MKVAFRRKVNKNPQHLIMDNVKILDRGERYTHASAGSLKSFEGKQFVKDATGATSCEISFGTLPSGASVPFSTRIKKTKRTTSSFPAKASFRLTMMCSM